MNDEELEAAMRSTLRSHAADAPLPGPQTAEVAQRRVRTRRRSTIVAGAAAAVLAITGGVVVAANYDSPADTPAASPPIVEPTRSAAGGIPSVFAYDAASAEALLTDAGLVVTEKPSYTCLTPERAVRTAPEAGTPFEPGDAVTLFVTTPPPAARCAYPADDDLAWELLDFANGRGPAPSFDSSVTVYVNGEPTVLTGAEAADQETWDADSALGLLGQASREQAERTSGAALTPRLVAESNPRPDTPSWCGDESLPSALADRQSILVGVDFPADGFQICTAANIFLTNGAVDAIVVRDHS